MDAHPNPVAVPSPAAVAAAAAAAKEPTKSYVVLDGLVATATGTASAGETVELTDKQAARMLARGTIGEPSGEKSREAKEKRDKQREANKITDDRTAADHVPFTGNTAGQPIAESDIPFNRVGMASVLDGDKAMLDAKVSRETKLRESAKVSASSK